MMPLSSSFGLGRSWTSASRTMQRVPSDPGEQVHPVHAGAEGVAGGMFFRGRLGDGGDVEIDRVAAANVHDPAVDQRDAEPLNPAAGGSVFEAARAAGIGGDGAAEEGHGFGGIRGIKLVGGLGGGVEFVEGGAGADGGEAIVNVEAAELFHRDLPATEGDAAAGEAAAAAGDSDGDFGLVRLGQDGEEFGFIGGDQGLFGVAFGTAGIFEIAPTHGTPIV